MRRIRNKISRQVRRGRRPYNDYESDSFWHKSLAYKIGIIAIIILTLIGPIITIITALLSLLKEHSEMRVIVLLVISVVVMLIGIFTMLYLTTRNRKKRKRRREIREAGLDRLEDGEEAITVEEFEKRYSQRQVAQMVERRPVLEILNEIPLNELLLGKMVFKGKILKEDKCAICKLSVKKSQNIVQCPKCLNLFHYEHLNSWFKNNKKCPVCGEIKEI